MRWRPYLPVLLNLCSPLIALSASAFASRACVVLLATPADSSGFGRIVDEILSRPQRGESMAIGASKASVVAWHPANVPGTNLMWDLHLDVDPATAHLLIPGLRVDAARSSAVSLRDAVVLSADFSRDPARVILRATHGDVSAFYAEPGSDAWFFLSRRLPRRVVPLPPTTYGAQPPASTSGGYHLSGIRQNY